MNYITLVINESVIRNFIMIGGIVVLGWLIFEIIEMIEKQNKWIKKEEAEIRAKPYKKKYEELLSKGKYKEALSFAEKHKVHMQNSYYYW